MDAPELIAEAAAPIVEAAVISQVRGQARAVADSEQLLDVLAGQVTAGDHVVFMSNGGFDNAPRRLLARLQGGCG